MEENYKGCEAYLDGNFFESLELFTSAINLDSSNPNFYVRRAKVSRELGLLEDALMDISKALKIDKNNCLFLYEKGYVRYQTSFTDFDQFRPSSLLCLLFASWNFTFLSKINIF